MNALTPDVAAAPTPVELPEIVWLMGHPTIAEREPRGTRLRRCIRCDTRDGWTLRCEPGLVVHLIDPADVHAAPEVFDGMPWAEPDTIAKAHEYWEGKGFRIVRKPGPVTYQAEHPRFQACPRCNEERMRSGLLGVNLGEVPGAARERGTRRRSQR